MWIVTLFALFNLKHFLCDYVFQTPRMIADKSQYGAWGGVSHALVHAVGSLVAMLIALPLSIEIAIIIVLLSILDGVVHYHIDWIKSIKTKTLTHKDRLYWIYFGADQAMHYLTYIIIISILLFI